MLAIYTVMVYRHGKRTRLTLFLFGVCGTYRLGL